MSFSSSRRGASRFSGREGRERSNGKDRSEEQDRKNSRGSGRDRDRSPRASGGHDYPSSRRSPARRSPRRGDRQSPSRRSSPRRSPLRRSSPRRSPQGGSRSGSYRVNSFPGEREQFQSEQFKRDMPRESRDMSRGAVDVLNPDSMSKMDNSGAPHRCELVVMDVDGRQCMYADHIRMRMNEFGLFTELVVLAADANAQTIQAAVQDAYRRQILIACVINEQNAVHRSLTVNLLIGQQQEHRNMPLDSAIGLMMRSFEQWSKAQGDTVNPPVGGNQQLGAPPPPGQARSNQALRKPPALFPTPEVFKKPDENIIRMLRMVIDGRNLVVEELDEIVEYFQEQRNRLASARGIAPLKQPSKQPTGGESQAGGNSNTSFEDERQGLQDKILGMLKSDPSLYHVLKGIDPTGAALPPGIRQVEGIPHGLPGADKLLNLFQEKQAATLLGMNKPPQRKEAADMSTGQRFGPGSGSSLLGEPPSRMGSAGLGGQSGGQEFKGMQDKIMDIFQGRDSKPSLGQGALGSYGRDVEQYMTMQPKDFGQTRSGYGSESGGRASERPGLLGNSYGGEAPTTQRSDFSANRYQNELEKPGILGNPYGNEPPANGRSNYRPPGDFPRGHQSGNTSQFAGGSGGGFSMPPGFGDTPKPAFRDSVYPTRQESSASQMQTTPTPEWMQKQQAPPQRYSRFS